MLRSPQKSKDLFQHVMLAVGVVFVVLEEPALQRSRHPEIFVVLSILNASTAASQHLHSSGTNQAFFAPYRCNATGQQINDIDKYKQVCV